MVVELIEKYVVLQSPARIEELVKVFIHATKVSLSHNSPRFHITKLTIADGNWFLGNVSRTIDFLEST